MIRFKRTGCIATVLCGLTAAVSLADTIWDPASNGVNPPAAGAWGDAGNWTAGLPSTAKAKFGTSGAADCEVSGTFSGMQIVQGDNGDGGILRILSGGSVTTKAAQWAAVGYNDTAYTIVDAGGTYNFSQNALIGFLSGAIGTLDISGTVTVGGNLALGFSSGVGYVNVLDGGVLALTTIYANGDAVKGSSVIDLSGSGQLTVSGNVLSVLQTYVDDGKITGDDTVGNVTIDLTTNPGFTTAMSATTGPAEPGPPITITALGGNNYELSWPKEVGPFEPEATDDLMSTGSWSAVSGRINISSNDYSKVVTADDPKAFYRLYRTAVDNTTLHYKSMMGYQGWFSAYGDGTQINDRWHHWAQGSAGYPNIGDWGIDFYPDMSEYSAEELYTPGWTLNNGDTAYLYSAANPKTIDRHCRWMWEYGIDGVFLQRFLGEVQDSRFFDFRNKVTSNMRAGAEAHGRLFAIMYDISGVDDGDLLADLTSDWGYLTGTLGVTNSPSYAGHNGKPVVCIWGIGFKGRGYTAATATAIINFFKGQGMTVMGGVPDGWRDRTGASETDPAWDAVYRSLDIISPWTVGRYGTIGGVLSWRANEIVPDLAETTAEGIDYMPVIFPGFSWHNTKKDEVPRPPLNQTPRLGGDFYWTQAYAVQYSGCTMMYTAMFDEMDEGTAMLKMAATTNELPAGATMVALDVDGESLPSDWYLQVGGEAARMLRGEIPLQASLPISP